MVLQYSDRNVGPRDYLNLAPDQLLVTKIFYTIQGEGPYAGEAAVFIRLAGCNRGDKEKMGCEFCDTNFLYSNGRAMTFREIASEMRHVVLLGVEHLHHHPLVVITGGEPMMQDNIVGFIDWLTKTGWAKIQIESNGDRLARGFLQGAPMQASLVVSPKATAGKIYRPKDEVLQRADALKFVVDSRPHSPYYLPPPWATFHHAHSDCYLSPLTVYRRQINDGETSNAWNLGMIDVAATQKNYERVAELVLKYGYRASMQQHLFFKVP